MEALVGKLGLVIGGCSILKKAMIGVYGRSDTPLKEIVICPVGEFPNRGEVEILGEGGRFFVVKALCPVDMGKDGDGRVMYINGLVFTVTKSEATVWVNEYNLEFQCEEEMHSLRAKYC